ncbi:MAG: class I SAM-dependent methyltransferase [Planctomycetota bacterium]
MIGQLVRLLRHRELDGVPLDSPERVRLHRAILARKRILRCVYDGFHRTFLPDLDQLPVGPRVELGTAWSHLHEVVPGLIRTDIAAVDGAALRVDARHLPFADGSLAALFLINTLHHVPDPLACLCEAARALKPGGLMMLVEPHATVWSLVVWGISGHEHFDQDPEWEFRTTGPLSGSNLALSWKIFHRDLERFRRESPNLEIVRQSTHTGFTYLLSGGFTMKALVPSFLYGPLYLMDRMLSKLSRGVSDQFETIILRRREGS